MKLGHIRIVHQNINLLELRRQITRECANLLDITDIELHNMDFHALCKPLDLLLDFLERILAARCEDKLQVIWLGARKLQRGALSDA